MMMKHYIVYVLRTVPSCTKKHRGAEEMNISEPLTCQWDAGSGQGCFRVWRQWSLEFSLQKDVDFCSQKEEFSIRSTLSGDNPNIDHWMNLGNTDSWSLPWRHGLRWFMRTLQAISSKQQVKCKSNYLEKGQFTMPSILFCHKFPTCIRTLNLQERLCSVWVDKTKTDSGIWLTCNALVIQVP